MLSIFFAGEAVEAAEEEVEAIFEFINWEVPGAGVVDLVAAEGFLELSEAVPGVIRVVGGGDAPEVEGVGTLGFGVEDHLDEEDGAGHELAVGVVGGGVGVVAGAVVIVNQGGGDRDGRAGGSCGRSGGDGGIRRRSDIGDGAGESLGDVEGGEAGFELMFEMIGVLGGEMVALADAIEEGSKNGDLLGVGGGTEGETFLGMVAPEASLVLVHRAEDVVGGLSEVDHPSVGGVEIVRLNEA